MRYLVGFVVVAALLAPPLSVSAQAGQEGATPELSLEEPAPPSQPASEEIAPASEPAPEEPSLQLQLDAAGVDVVSSPPWTADEAELRSKYVKRDVRAAKIGLGVSAGVFAGGAGLLGAAFATDDFDSGVFRFVGGVFLMTGGLIGVSISAAKLVRNKRKLRELQQARYGPTS